MPLGTVRWFDPRDGKGDIEDAGRHYPVSGEQMEPAARVAGARVQFDVLRDGNVERAVNVRRREGTRTGRAQRRMGDLTGAHSPDDKAGAARTHRAGEAEPRLSGQPAELVRRWLVALAGPNADAALPLYAPDAVVHVDGADLNGRNRVREFLYDHDLIGRGAVQGRVRGVDGVILVEWPATPGQPARSALLRVLHGRIVEQWGPNRPS